MGDQVQVQGVKLALKQVKKRIPLHTRLLHLQTSTPLSMFGELCSRGLRLDIRSMAIIRRCGSLLRKRLEPKDWNWLINDICDRISQTRDADPILRT